MPSIDTIPNLEARIDEIENAMAAAAAGDYSAQVLTDLDDPDPFTSIETGINVLISDLGDEVMRSQKRAEELEEKLQLIHAQRRAIQELSTPILEIWENVLALPIIGVVDTRRSAELMEKLLAAVEDQNVRYVILDITGVEVVDTKTADHFIKVIKAAELLGARCVLTGIGPAVAQTLVDIGVDLASVSTLRTLRDGLRFCLRLIEKDRAG
jgi:rsbT co-antagonist protein RsbR